MSVAQKANFATTSRLLKCIINEGLANAYYYNNNNNSNDNDDIDDTELNNSSFSPPSTYHNNNHSPLLFINNKIKNSRMVEFIDPWDMIAPVYKIQFVDIYGDDQPKSLLSYCLKSLYLAEEIEAPDLMKLIGIWLNLNNKIVDEICDELNSSILYQGMHKSRKAVPPIPPIPPSTYNFDRPMIRFVSVPIDKVSICGPIQEFLNQLYDIMNPKPVVSTNQILIPVHELQLPNILEKFPYITILDSSYSIQAISQVSLRTVVFPKLLGFSYKLSLGIKVTSALRTISPWTTHIGVGLCNVFDKLEIDQNILKISKEIASIVSNEKDFDVAKHLSCIIRSDIGNYDSADDSGGSSIDDKEKIIICAALTEKDENGKIVVEKVFELNTEEKRIKFLERYSNLLFKAFLPTAMHNGFAFEAHPQNVLARFNSTGDQLLGFVIRDFGGVRFHQETIIKSIGQPIDVLEGSVTLAKDLQTVYDKLYHTLIMCHIHRLIRSLDLHYSGIGWKIIREQLSAIIPRNHLLWELWMRNDKINSKCFLRMKCESLYQKLDKVVDLNKIAHESSLHESRTVLHSEIDIHCLVYILIILEEDNRILNTFAGFAGNVNNVIGSGIFTTPGIVWQTVGSPGAALILWMLGGLISFCGSLTYVEFGTITLESGGEVAFFKRAFPVPQMLMSYVFSFVWICAIRPATIAAVLQALSQYFLFAILPHPDENDISENKAKYCDDSIRFYQQLHPNNGWNMEFWLLKSVGITSLSLITCYHMRSNVCANIINQALATVKMTTLTVIIIIGFVKLFTTDLNDTNWINLFKGSTVAPPNLAIVSSDDINKPGKDFNEVIAAFFAKKIGGEKFARALAFFVSLSAFGAASSMTWSGSRVIVAAAKDNLIPFYSDGLKRWHNEYFTPYNALIVQYLWCIIVFITIGGAFSSDSFKVLSDFGTYVVWIFYFLASVGLLNQKLIDHLMFDNPEYDNLMVDCQKNATRIENYIKSVISIGFIISGLICWYISYYKKPNTAYIPPVQQVNQ
nr:3130_t:CDS:10 [Entrophospora candida]